VVAHPAWIPWTHLRFVRLLMACAVLSASIGLAAYLDLLVGPLAAAGVISVMYTGSGGLSSACSRSPRC